MSGVEAWAGAYWPYVLLVLLGFLPSEVWRVGAAVLARWVDEDSEVFTFTRLVATALVAAVVAKLLVQPPPALAAVPEWGRAGALALAAGVYFAAGRRLILAVATGIAAVVALAALHGS
jgi:hypothetical protein